MQSGGVFREQRDACYFTCTLNADSFFFLPNDNGTRRSKEGTNRKHSAKLSDSKAFC